MNRDFEDFIEEIHEEARRGGPKAIAELAAFDAHHLLAREVFDLRKARGMTQRQLAAKSGIQQAEISRIEAGNSNPTLSTIAVLAYALEAELSLEVRKASRTMETRRTTTRVAVTARRRTMQTAAARQASVPVKRSAKARAR
jgi:transcriptional regulator with XRE-family HTH domain